MYTGYLFCILIFGCTPASKEDPTGDILVKTEGKSPMILLTDRPLNLETPLKYFLHNLTPNEVFFVRWHLPVLPPEIDADTFRLRISGLVEKELAISLRELKSNYPQDSVIALAACAGNARSFCDPRVPGAQWKNGGMGNAKWTGVRLKDILQSAGIKNGAVEVTFNGMDLPSYPTVPDFVKSLPFSKAMSEEVIVAYAMNDEPLPLLNGYPLKLVVPGWYATYWVGMLHEIRVVQDTFDGFWMSKAYLIPRNVTDGNENPDSLSTDMEPIHRLDIRSIFVSPEPDSSIRSGMAYDIQGLAFDAGTGIEKVEISRDDGKTWSLARLDPEISPWSWRRWHYAWHPDRKGDYTFWVKATNALGETQPMHHWNRSGYMRNEIESLTLSVE
jgi:DMSO/TMAO reductase YedYZ molybdopterin-dependent catalytic subunit